VSTAVERDADTIALFGEFFEESEDALAEAERLLMEGGEGGLSKESVHGLFRVFHTLKGVAGFLELEEVSRLAHHTETLLGNVREGTLEIGPSAFECLLQVTTLMGKLVSGVAAAVRAGQVIPTRGAEVTKLVHWIEAETRGEARGAGEDAELEISTKVEEHVRGWPAAARDVEGRRRARRRDPRDDRRARAPRVDARPRPGDVGRPASS
jgi:two-component system chemotaxis sensor kinase CheA